MAKRSDIAAIRMGYGLGGAPMPEDPDAIVAGLLTDDDQRKAYPMTGLAQASVLAAQLQAARRDLRKGVDGAKDEAKTLRRAVIAARDGAARQRLARILDTDTPFRERLTGFWVDHFTAVGQGPGRWALVPAFVDEAVRPNIAGRFADLLKAAVLHPLMLEYLDQSRSAGPNSRVGRTQRRGMNENLAREVLELHTLGSTGTYSQADVRQFAELLTGMTYTPRKGVRFQPALAEPGPESVLGATYGGPGGPAQADITEFLEDLAVHPDTARHVARKLAVHFQADTPDPDLVASLERAYRDSGGALTEVYRALLSHPAMWTEPGGKAKQPFDFVASSFLALGMQGSEVAGWKRRDWRQYVEQPMVKMGQDFFSPPGPDGWPEAADAWITPQGLSQRIVWSMRTPAALRDTLPDPRAFVQTALGSTASRRLAWAVGAAETRPQGVGLVLSAPEFNRR
ncbi:Uncharacterized conserved protein, DUF1800 family [Tranquillimonas rosea]|uniref:Uncharacterized conserved protein, DUF1800 family n=1 Tax=Tranquillimonas rosea TaxID=641238 RepID=A0A1H9RME8_9RHOB|nr:DUF1800 domain-containing protein [Tranquillimonas rosea]SER73894.1 Uncharacterized conserved protein, DUF1800 family [Tranquillimonas rosea]